MRQQKDGRSRTIRFLTDRRGGTLTLTAIVFPALIGFSGLALDGANWYAQRRATQNMVDAAAIAAAYAKLADDSLEEITAVARAEAERNGFQEAAGDSISVTEVTSGPVGSAQPLVSVTIAHNTPLYFAQLLMEQASVTISARAVSGVRNLGPQCIISLDETAARAVEFTGNTTADIGCGVASNSDSAEALYVGGSAILMANPAQAFGDIAIEGNGELISQLPPLPFSPRVPDPFADLPDPPRNAPCDATVSSQTDIGSILPGAIAGGSGDGFITLCGDVQLSGNLALPAATYVIKGDLDVKSNANITGDGVTFILTHDDPADTGRLTNFGSNATVTLSAPTSGPWQGLLFYQDPLASCAANQPNRFTGGPSMSLDGVIYAPACAVDFRGNTANSDGCLQIVSRTVSFSGNSTVKNEPAACQQFGLDDSASGQKQVVLLE